MEIFIEVFRNTILITGLVMVMLLLIESVHIYSQGRSFERLQRRPLRQIALAALLGLIPGCIGGFAAVSLYAHGIIGFGALVAMMVSTMGDEAFVLFAAMPKTGLLLGGALLLLALLTGWLTHKFFKKGAPPFTTETHYPLHAEEGCHHGAHSAVWGNWRENFRTMSLKRGALLIGLLLFIASMGLGLLEHDHPLHLHDHTHSSDHHLHLFNERWLNLLFSVLALVTLILTVMASNHFISEHLWGHIIKRHLLKISLWTFGALLCISVVLQYLHLEEWVVQNGYIFLLLAALIGLIPESGPHLFFVALFASGAAPFSVLFTNFFIQDGHTALPLLAESKGAFLKAKAIKFVVGIALGSILYFCGL
jgi:hypothetical protein